MQYSKIFNFMAIVIRTLIDNTTPSFYVRYDACTWEKQEFLKTNIEHDLPELFTTKADFLSSLLEGILMQKLNTFFSKCREKNNYDMMLVLLTKLDILLKEEIESHAMLSTSRRFEQNVNNEDSFCLNNNITQCNLQILPKCTCKWSHNKRDKTASKSVNVYLKNCYYILLENLKEYKLKHLFLTNQFERSNKTNSLKIGLSPICNTAKLDISFYEKTTQIISK